MFQEERSRVLRPSSARIENQAHVSAKTGRSIPRQKLRPFCAGLLRRVPFFQRICSGAPLFSSPSSRRLHNSFTTLHVLSFRGSQSSRRGKARETVGRLSEIPFRY